MLAFIKGWGQQPGGSRATIPNCEKIRALGVDYDPLAKVCDFALSENQLPNLVCHENVQQFETHTNPPDWRLMDAVDAELTVRHGRGEIYSNLTINGKAEKSMQNPHDWLAVNDYFEAHEIRFYPGNFGNDILDIFSYPRETQFEHTGEMQFDGKTYHVFRFTIKKGRDLRRTFSSGNKSSGSALEGILWIEEETSLLRRTVVRHKEFDAGFPVTTLSSATDYRLVPIPPLGDFLLPVQGESLACFSSEVRCYRNQLSFTNCRRFGSQFRIIPQQPLKP